MPFVDVLNSVQKLLAPVNNEESFKNLNGNEYRFVIIDNDNKLVTLEKTIRNNVSPETRVTLYRLSDNDGLENSINLCNGKLFLALIMEANQLSKNREQNVSFLEQILQQLQRKIRLKNLETRRLAASFIEIDLYLIFDVGDIRVQCQHYARSYAGIFANLPKDDELFPNLRVIFTTISEENHEVKQNLLADQLTYLHLHRITSRVQDLPQRSNFIENDYPWISLRMFETFSPEVIIFQWLYEFLRAMITDSFENITAEIKSSKNDITDAFLRRIDGDSFKQINDDFKNWLDYVPVQVEKAEWDRSSDIKTKNVAKTIKKFLGIKKTVYEEITYSIGTPINTDTDVLKKNFISYICSKVSQDDMCFMLIEKIRKIKRNPTEAEFQDLRNCMIELITDIFNVANDENNLWAQVRDYYIEGFTLERIRLCYRTVSETVQNVINMIESQITAWTEMSSVIDQLEFEGLQIQLSGNIEKIYTQIIKMIEELQRNEEFKTSMSDVMRNIDNSNPAMNNIDGLHILVDRQYLNDIGVKATESIDETNIVKARKCFYLSLDSIDKMVGDSEEI